MYPANVVMMMMHIVIILGSPCITLPLNPPPPPSASPANVLFSTHTNFRCSQYACMKSNSFANVFKLLMENLPSL